MLDKIKELVDEKRMLVEGIKRINSEPTGLSQILDTFYAEGMIARIDEKLAKYGVTAEMGYKRWKDVI